jgi:hypothetical protein
VRAVTLGSLFGFALPGLIVFVSAVSFGGFSMNLAALTPFVFSLSLAYAVVRRTCSRSTRW